MTTALQIIRAAIRAGDHGASAAYKKVQKLQKAPRYWVATYGDMGLDVTHYTSRKEYDAACTEAEAEHNKGELDSYTHGTVE